VSNICCAESSSLIFFILILVVIDYGMVRASLTPSSEVQQDCVYWLDEYFTTYGDFIPNSDNEIRMAQIRASDMHAKYVKECEVLGNPFVNKSLFSSIWNSLFPNCSSRPWCGIMGKCATCCVIDKLRRESPDTLVQHHLQEARSMHRSNFMGQRRW
jgi:hypothetical protein